MEMSGIHDEILSHVRDALQKALIDDIADWEEENEELDPAKAGVVTIGALQGDPAPDTARISVSVFANDPDAILGGANTGLKGDWSDEVEEREIGGTLTYRRRFSVRGRCLLADTRESADQARSIASTVRERIETTLAGLSFADVASGSEYVSMPIFGESIDGEMLQSGGPPDAYDYHLKIRFSVLTTKTGVI
jgi:hypothetical protein